MKPMKVDARWDDVRVDVESAVRHLENAQKIFLEDDFSAPGLVGYKSEMAFMHAMHAGYTSFESALSRVLDIMGEELPGGNSWRADLLRRVSRPIEGSRPAILSKKAFEYADMLRRFRHVANRTYDSFNARDASASADAAGALSSMLGGEIGAFVEVIDPPGDGGHDVDARSMRFAWKFAIRKGM